MQSLARDKMSVKDKMGRQFPFIMKNYLNYMSKDVLFNFT